MEFVSSIHLWAKSRCWINQSENALCLSYVIKNYTVTMPSLWTNNFGFKPLPSMWTGSLVNVGPTVSGKKKYPLPTPPLATSLSASSFQVLPAAVRPFHQQSVHRLALDGPFFKCTRQNLGTSARSRPCTEALNWASTYRVPRVWTQHRFVPVPRHKC